jgi:FMN phosphatase YigB (HAD superfamily)
MIKYIFFDVSGTILGKPILFQKINEALNNFGYIISLDEIKYKHKLLSEIIHFPDRTDVEFYNYFNAELLRLLGIIPTEELLSAIFESCTYLPWEKFEDSKVLTEIEIPIGVISNFNSTLKDKLNQFFGPVFKDILVSEELGIAKPKIGFYQKALDEIGYDVSEILYIGDSMKLDIEPASQLGIKSLLIDRDDFYQKSSYKISSLNEILKHI